MIINVEGQEGTAKSSFAYTAPLPIVGFSLDMGHKRALYGKLFPTFFEGLKIAIHPYKKPKIEWKNGQATASVEHEPFEGNDITIYEMPTPLQLDSNKVEGFMAQWAYMLTIYVKALQDSKVNTAIIDTMTLAYKHKCEAYLEELNMKGNGTRKQLLQIEYGHPNEGIRTLYQFATSTGKNLVAVHHLRDHYVSRPGRDGVIESVSDGTLETDGMRDTGRYVDISLRMEKKDGKLISKMNKCGPNLELEGQPIFNASWDSLMELVEMGWYGPKFPRRKDETELAK